MSNLRKFNSNQTSPSFCWAWHSSAPACFISHLVQYQVCMNELVPDCHLYQCDKGHIICGNCQPRIRVISLLYISCKEGLRIIIFFFAEYLKTKGGKYVILIATQKLFFFFSHCWISKLFCCSAVTENSFNQIFFGHTIFFWEQTFGLVYFKPKCKQKVNGFWHN